ncbi:hypothetical protein ABH930_004534 [Kitasatospora sp. GAS204A]|uniref:DUF6542 domain-containing protein n=1 Tax=unclassified Kitasatospora TaxID=2633591 RepID=UPI002476B094|nr:DUF6542 domain-containing protein [Kitasatospora sp. GAS204B]MDH6119773.1 hypothetical protein [Kitasatospora sp. GAS204B]
MAEQQWAFAPDEELEMWRDRTVPPARAGVEGSEGQQAPGGSGRGPHQRHPPAGSRRHAATVALLLLGLPLIGVCVDEATGPGLGMAFTFSTALGAACAAAMANRSDWWWVMPVTPTVVLAASALGTALSDPAGYQNSKALAVSALRWSVTGFPVMVMALSCAAAVVVVRLAHGGRRRRG